MSSISFRKPEFRLYLGYPDIVLKSAGRTLGRVATEAADFRSALGRLAEVVRQARGRLVAVLPEGEVWRGRLDLAGRDRTERSRSARMIVAGRLGATPDDVTVVLGARAVDGSFPVAGVRCSTLLETRALLAAVGLRPSAIVGAPGFVTSPRLDGGWSWPSLPALPVQRRGVSAALGAGAIVGLAVLVLGAPNPPAPIPAGVAPMPVSLPIVAEAPVGPPRLAQAEPPPAVPASLALRTAERPRPRPASLRPQAIVTVAARNMPDDLPPKAQPPRPKLERLAKLTTAPIRAIDATISAPLRRPAGKPAPQAPAVEVAAEVEQEARTAMPVLPAPATASDLRPMPRPQAKVAAPATPAAAAKPAPTATSAALTPRPRAQAEPSAAEPSAAAVLVASLEPAPFAEATLAAAAAATVATALETPPPARPKGLAAPAPAKSAAKPAAKPAPVAAKPTVVRPKPVAVVRPKPLSVQPLVKQAVPQRQVVVASAAPQRLAPAPAKPKVVAVAPKPKIVAVAPKPVRQKVVAKPVPVRQVAKAVPAKPKPVQVAAKPVREKAATQRVGLSRGNISLVGVFASSDGRTALVRLPNGNIEKVKAGDRVQGVQVAAISADSVRLTGRGKDTLLRLPD